MAGLSLRLQFECRWVCFAEINPLICGNMALWLIYKDFTVFEWVLFGVSLCAQPWVLQGEHPWGSPQCLEISMADDSSLVHSGSSREKSNQEAWVRCDPAQTVWLCACLSTLRAYLMLKYFLNMTSQCIHNLQHMAILHIVCNGNEFAIIYSLAISISPCRHTLLEGPGLIFTGFQRGSLSHRVTVQLQQQFTVCQECSQSSSYLGLSLSSANPAEELYGCLPRGRWINLLGSSHTGHTIQSIFFFFGSAFLWVIRVVLRLSLFWISPSTFQLGKNTGLSWSLLLVMNPFSISCYF